MNRLENLRTAYHVLEDEVQTALRTQLGDAEQLQIARGKVLRLAERFEQVQLLCPLSEKRKRTSPILFRMRPCLRQRSWA
jgi:hypothetical protein